MKVAYLIFSNEHGTGGHHHSMKAIKDSQDIYPDFESFVINLGVAPSPVIRNDKNYVFFRSNEFNIIYNILRVVNFVRKNDISVLHAFDVNAYFYTRLVSYILNVPSVYTKCGGENFKYNPKSIFGIAISGENFDFLQKHKKHKNLYLFENRIAEFKLDHGENERVRKLLKKDNKIIFLRITRITNYYRSSIMKTVTFVSNIQAAVLVFIGSIYDQSLADEISDYCKVNNVDVYFFSEAKYTNNARQYIGIGDYVFGTGRTAMEVLAARRKLLAFAKNASHPIIVNLDNFDYFRYKNFSERVDLPYVPTEKSVIGELFSKEDNERDLELYEKFKQHYFINYKISDYRNLYVNLTTTKEKGIYFWDFLRNAYAHILRTSIILKYLIRVKSKLRS